MALIPEIKFFECIGCNKKSAFGITCAECRPSWHLDQLLACSDYNNPRVEKAVKGLKYRFIKELAIPISCLMKKYLTRLGKNGGFNIIAEAPVIISVPLHRRRLNWRGFNQSGLIAELLATSLQLRFYPDILIRGSAPKHQADITERNIRLINVKDRFSISMAITALSSIKNRDIVIVDDVATTGATLNECAKILKLNGAKKVIGLVFARG